MRNREKSDVKAMLRILDVILRVIEKLTLSVIIFCTVNVLTTGANSFYGRHKPRRKENGLFGTIKTQKAFNRIG